MSALQELPIDFHVAVSELQPVARRKPVGAPGLYPGTRPPDPAPQQVPIAGVAGTETTVGVDEPLAKFTSVSRAQSFQAEIQFWDLRNLGKVNARIQRRTGRAEGRNLIHYQGVVVDGQPLSQAGHAIAEIESGKPFPRILGNIGFVRIISSQEIAPGKGQPRPPKDSADPHAEFQVGS